MLARCASPLQDRAQLTCSPGNHKLCGYIRTYTTKILEETLKTHQAAFAEAKTMPKDMARMEAEFCNLFLPDGGSASNHTARSCVDVAGLHAACSGMCGQSFRQFASSTLGKIRSPSGTCHTLVEPKTAFCADTCCTIFMLNLSV